MTAASFAVGWARRIARAIGCGYGAIERSMREDPVRWSSHESLAGWTSSHAGADDDAQAPFTAGRKPVNSPSGSDPPR